jgi:hypothetical protein
MERGVSYLTPPPSLLPVNREEEPLVEISTT